MIYLDNGATSWPKPPCVHEAIVRFLTEGAANPGRSAHRLAVAAERMLDDIRGRLTRLFDGDHPERLILSLNCTDALNMAIKGVLREGDHVIWTTLEHNSVSRPLQRLAEAGFVTLTRVPSTGGGFVDPDAVAAAVTPRTRLIACTHLSNVLATIQPAEQIGRVAREHDVLFLLDAAQSAGLLPISIRGMHVDLLAFSGHKALLGPTGTGGLCVGERVDPMPWREGGTGSDSVTPVQPHVYPYWLEAGTPNTVGVAGLAAALDYLLERGPDRLLAHERMLTRRLVESLGDDHRFRLLGSPDWTRRASGVALTIRGLTSAEAAAILDQSFEIAVRPGLHCAPYVHQELGTFPDGAVRISPGAFNTIDEIDRVVEALRQIAP